MLAYWKRIQYRLRCSMTHHREHLVRWHMAAQRISMIPRVLPLLCPRMGWTPEGDTVCIRTHGLRCQWRGTCSPFSCPSRYDKTSSNAILQYLPPWNLMVCFIFSQTEQLSNPHFFSHLNSDERLKSLPASIGQYHSLYPMDNPARDKNAKIFGYVTSMYKCISSVDGNIHPLERIFFC